MSDSELGYSGYSTDGYSDRSGIDRLPQLRGDQWYQTVREMTEQDATIGAVLFAVEMMMRAVQWSAEAADDSDEATKWSDYLEQCFDDMPDSWPNVVADGLTYLPYGYSLFELCYKQRNGITDDPKTTSKFDDGLIGWRKWAFRPQNTKSKWIVKDGDVVGWEQKLPDYSTVVIPAEKYVVFRSSARGGNPEGQSILKGCYRAYYHKKEIEIQEAIGIGRDLAGVIWIQVPETVLLARTAEDQQTLNYYKKMVQNVHRGKQEGMITPSARDENGHLNVNVQLLNSGGQRQFDTSKIIDRYKTDIAMRFQADFILVGHQQVGAYNVSESKISNLERAVGGWLDMMEENVNEQSVARLMQLNGVPMKLWPKWKHDSVSKLNLDVLGTYIKLMIDAGLLPKTVELSKWAADEANMPIPSDEELEEFFAEPEPTPMVVPGADVPGAAMDKLASGAGAPASSNGASGD